MELADMSEGEAKVRQANELDHSIRDQARNRGETIEVPSVPTRLELLRRGEWFLPRRKRRRASDRTLALPRDEPNPIRQSLVVQAEPTPDETPSGEWYRF